MQAHARVHKENIESELQEKYNGLLKYFVVKRSAFKAINQACGN